MAQRGFRPLLSVFIVLNLATAWVSAEVLLYSRNTLWRDGQWISSKALMPRHLMGAYQFLITRTALARGRLNLAAWHGWNEVTFKDAVELGGVDFRFKLDPGAYLAVSLGRDAAGFSGVRLSRSPLLPSLCYRASRDGAFLQKTPLSLPEISGRWHAARCNQTDGSIAIYLDGERLAPRIPVSRTKGFVGFRCGGNAAAVDHVQIHSSSGVTLLDESFEVRQGFWLLLVASLVGLVVVEAGVILTLCKRRGWRFSRALVTQTAFTLGIFLCASIYFGFDCLAYSRLYPPEEPGPNISHLQGGAPIGIRLLESAHRVFRFRHRILFWFEETRKATLGGEVAPADLTTASFDWGSPVIRTLLSSSSGLADEAKEVLAFGPGFPGGVRGFDRGDNVVVPKRSNTFRVAMIGGSQTWGAGAENARLSWACLLQQKLQALASAGTEVEIFNLALSGFDVAQLQEQYRNHWADTRPDLVVLNVSYNDMEPEAFRQNLTTFIDLLQSIPAPVILLKEAYSIELSRPHVVANHRIEEEIATARSLPVFDFHGFLNSPEVRDRGFLWWDYAHLTSFGQELAADWLAEKLADPIHLAGRPEIGPH